MPSLGDMLGDHRARLKDAKRATLYAVLIHADRTNEDLVIAARDDDDGAWGTQRLVFDPVRFEETTDARAERLLSLMPLVSNEAQIFPLCKSERNPSPVICVGRGQRNDVVIADRSVSSLHTHVEFDEPEYILSDAGSSNGTFVNKRRLKANDRIRLRTGDCVRLGKKIFYFLTAERLHDFLGLRLVRGEAPPA